VSRNTTLVSSLGLRIGLAYAVGLSAGMRRKRVPPKGERKKGIEKERKEQTNKETKEQRKLLEMLANLNDNFEQYN